jgi:hypothetical protein
MDWIFRTTENHVKVRAHIYNLEDTMNKFRRFPKSRNIAASLLCIGVLCAALYEVDSLRAQSSGTAAALSDEALVAEYRRVEVASVSDALEQLTGKHMYMSHRMNPIFTTKFAGLRANGSQLKKDEGDTVIPAAL